MLKLSEFRLSTKICVLMGALSYLLACAHILVNQLVLLPNSLWRQMFDLGIEANIPTWFSSIYWLCVGFSAYLCYAAEKGRKARWPWILIGLVFTAASCDEASEIHENIGSLLQEFVMDKQVRALSEASPGSPWIGYYAPLLALVILGFVVFLFRRLTNLRSKIVVICAFACYAIAISMDFFQGMPDPQRVRLAAAIGVSRPALVEFSIIFEEMCEMLGCILLTNSFLYHAEVTYQRSKITDSI